MSQPGPCGSVAPATPRRNSGKVRPSAAPPSAVPASDSTARSHSGPIIDGRRVVGVAARAAGPEERQEDRAEHVERRQEHRDGQEHEGPAEARLPDAAEDRFLRDEAREGRHARERERAHDEHDRGPRHGPPEPAHGAHVVRVDGVDHGPRGEEQERLEEAVEQEVEHARHEGAGPERGHHVAELGHGRVREDALEVGLAERERRRQEGGERAHVGDQEEHPRHGLEERVGPRHQEHARRDHRGGVDQGRHGRRALHRVGQPDVERELGALAHGARGRSASCRARGSRGGCRPRPRGRACRTRRSPSRPRAARCRGGSPRRRASSPRRP